MDFVQYKGAFFDFSFWKSSFSMRPKN